MKKIGLFILTNGFLGALFCIAINTSSAKYIREYTQTFEVDGIGKRHLLVFIVVSLVGILLIKYSQEKNI